MEENPQNEFSISWEAPEFVFRPKTTFWYVMTGVIAALSALDVYLWLNNLTFATIIVLTGTIMIFLGDKKPGAIPYMVDWRGITINGISHRFHEFQSFWIIEKENETLLYLMPVKSLAQETLIPLEEVDLEQLHKFLFLHLPEEPASEPLSHKISGYLGF